jgi:hypothetical protein
MVIICTTSVTIISTILIKVVEKGSVSMKNTTQFSTLKIIQGFSFFVGIPPHLNRTYLSIHSRVHFKPLQLSMLYGTIPYNCKHMSFNLYLGIRKVPYYEKFPPKNTTK